MTHLCCFTFILKVNSLRSLRDSSIDYYYYYYYYYYYLILLLLLISRRDKGREKVDFEAEHDCIVDMHDGFLLETVEFKTITTGRELQNLILFKKLLFNL